MYLRQLESGRWQCVIRRRGHKPKSITKRTKAAAEKWGRETEDKLESGETEALTDTVEELLDRYERGESERKKGYTQEASRIRILTAHMGDMAASQLSVEDVLKFARDRLEKCSSDTVRRDVHVLSAMLDHAIVVWELPLENVARLALSRLTKAKDLKPPVKRIRRITREEEIKLYAELSFKNAVLVAFALETAMRRGELAKMRWEHIKGQSLLIPDDKTSKSATIPLSSIAIDVLEYLDGGPPGTTFNLRSDSITRAFNRACERAGVKNLRFHDLRHEAISRLFEKGLGIQEVCAISRHSDWSSLKIYTHPNHDSIREKLG